jgi:hypothetical protein
MRAAWYEKQGLAKDVLTLGEMPDPRPAAGEVRIRIAASGINPGDIKKRQDAFGYGMAYPASFRIAMALGRWMRPVAVFLPNASGSRSGATEPNPIARLVPRPSLRWFPWIKWLAYPLACRWSRAPVLGYPVSLHIAPSMLPASSGDGPC